MKSTLIIDNKTQRGIKRKQKGNKEEILNPIHGISEYLPQTTQ